MKDVYVMIPQLCKPLREDRREMTRRDVDPVERLYTAPQTMLEALRGHKVRGDEPVMVR